MLRTERGWTVDYVAEQLRVSSSKVSRLETGQRGVSARDIRHLCDLYEVNGEQRERLTELAREGKQRARWQARGLPYSTYVGLEAEATSIRDYGLGVMPGLLQNTDYARAVVRAQVPGWVPDAVELRVGGRIARQQLLFSEKPPRFEVVLDESVLHRVVGSAAIMRAQLKRLLELSELPSVTLQVIPYDAGALPSGTNKFIVLSFASATVSDVVFIEGLTGDLYLDDPHDVEVYNLTFRKLVDLAADPDRTREMIAAMIESYEARQTSQTAWRKASFCQNGECVELAQQNGMIVMRNSREPHGRVLHYTVEEWHSFVRAVKSGEFDDLVT